MMRCIVCREPMEQARIRGLLRCVACGFTSADMCLSQAELESLYSEKYFRGEEYADYLADRRVAEKSFRGRLQTLLEYVPEPGSKSLFEVGCAYGLFLNLARDSFGEVAGIDISRHAVEFARSELGLNASCGDLLSFPLPDRIDVACLWDTIEHLSEPGRYIEALAQKMPAGSVIAITTGDIESAVARWRGAKWRQIHPPTHLHYFSRATLTRLLQQHGFRVRYAGYDGMYRSLETMSYIIFTLKRKQPRVHDILKRSGLLKFDLYLNLRDILFVIAEKVP